MAGQPVPCVAVAVIQARCAVDGAEEIIGVVALEGKAAALTRFGIVGRDGVAQAAGRGDDGHGAVVHGDELGQAAGLGL